MIRMPLGWALCLVLALPSTTAAQPTKPARSAPVAKARLVVAAGDSVKCTIRSIHGLKASGGIDKRLNPLRKQLAKDPFSAFRTMKLLKAVDLDLPQSVTKQVKLPTGKILKLTFKEKLLARKDQLKLRLHLSITPPKKKGYLPGTLFTIANRGTLLQAGDKHNGGILVVGITCQAK